MYYLLEVIQSWVMTIITIMQDQCLLVQVPLPGHMSFLNSNQVIQHHHAKVSIYLSLTPLSFQVHQIG
jgi:hypothetical protein